MNPELLSELKPKIREVGLQNGVVTRVRNLISNSKPNPERLFVIEGIWAHNKAVMTNLPVVSFVICPEYIYTPESEALVRQFAAFVDEVYVVSAKTFDRLSERDKPDGLLSICRFPVRRPEDLHLPENACVVVLYGLEIPGNIGTIIRTCDGADVDAVLVCNRRARLSHPKVVKGSMGAAFRIPIVEFQDGTDCSAWLREQGFSIYLADTRAEKTYYDYAYQGRCALIMGSERYGIHKEWYNHDYNMLMIPMLGICDSLNVGVAASILIYEMSLKSKGRMTGRSSCPLELQT
ncbi:MAG: hypothetical protein IJT76_06715 [Clostridia bacterium]|nr:hypothetical protein [Clostridia bacterium]